VPHYAERFTKAVETLIGEGSVKQRLVSAYSLHLKDVTEADLPPASRREFAELQAAINRVAPVGKETRALASVQKMSTREATGHAATIVKLYVDLMNGLTERAEPLKVVGAPRNPPRYLAGRS
jgi:hypothetical protein